MHNGYSSTCLAALVMAVLSLALPASGQDCNENGIPDECDIDCGTPGGPCDVLGCGLSLDDNTNMVPDECEFCPSRWEVMDHEAPIRSRYVAAQAGDRLWLWSCEDAKLISFDPWHGYYPATSCDGCDHDMNAAIACYGGYVYVFGGSSARTDRYAPATGWEQRADAPATLIGSRAAVLGDLIYVFSGWTPTYDPSNATYVYDPVQDTWTTGPDMVYAAGYRAYAVHDDYIYVLGGLTVASSDHGESTHFERFSIGVGWEALAPLPLERAGSAAAVVGDYIYLLGGRSNGGASHDSQVLAYHTTSDTWTDCAPMAYERFEAGVGVFGLDLYVLGGMGIGILQSTAERSRRDCNDNGTPDFVDIGDATSNDCNQNGIPDECEIGYPAEFVLDMSADPGFVTYEGTAPLGQWNPAGYYEVLFGQQPQLLYVPMNLAAMDEFVCSIRYRNPVRGYKCMFGLASHVAPAGTVVGTQYVNDLYGGFEWYIVSPKALDEQGALWNPDWGVTSNQSTSHEYEVYMTRTCDGPDTLLTWDLYDLTAGVHDYSDSIILDGFQDPFLYFIIDDSCSGPGILQLYEVSVMRQASILESNDCNGNGIPDDCDIETGASLDCNANDWPDECEIAEGIAFDCNTNGIPDVCDILTGVSSDCNHNDVPDECDIAAGTSTDCTGNAIPDECEPDCNGNGVADSCDIQSGASMDCQGDGVPDECQLTPDCDSNGIPDDCPLLGSVVVSWIGDAGLWTNSPDWCPSLVPTNQAGATFDVTIADPDSVVTLDINPTIDALSIENDAVVEVNAGSGADVRTLVVGWPIANDGTIRAVNTVPGTLRRLLIDASDIVQTATGVIEASGDAGADATVQINGQQVTGGILRTTGNSAAIELLGGAVLVDVTVEGNVSGRGELLDTVRVPGGQSAILGQDIVNEGLIGVGEAGVDVSTTLYAAASTGVTLRTDSGAGRLQLRSPYAYLGDFFGSVTNQANHTIEGAGVLFGELINERTGEVDALVEANVDGKSLLISPPGLKTNEGVFRATAGGILGVWSDVVGNGNLEATEGGILQFDSVYVENHSLIARGGTIRMDGVVAALSDGIDLPPGITPGQVGLLEIIDSNVSCNDWLSVTYGSVWLSALSAVTVANGPVLLCPDTASNPSAVAELHITDLISTLSATDMTIGRDHVLGAEGMLDIAGVVTLSGGLSFANQVESNWSWGPSALLELTGGQGLADDDPTRYVRLEIGGEDLGYDPDTHYGHPDGFVENFHLTELALGSGAHVTLVDLMDNGNRGGPTGDAEALYVKTLRFADGTGRLNLNGLHLYYETIDPPGSEIVQLTDCRLADSECDSDVDLQDFARFQTCFGANQIPAECARFDFDGDGVVDLYDYEVFEASASGPGGL